MTWLRQLPIKRKLNLVVVMTCLAVMGPVFVAVIGYQAFDLRRTLARETMVLAGVLARNSEADLAFKDEDGAAKTLLAAEAEPGVAAACLYDDQGRPFAQYRRLGAQMNFPPRPPANGSHFGQDYLVVAQPVMLNGKRIGTLYLMAGLQGMRDQLLWSVAIGCALLAVCVLAALALSSKLQRPISEPILALAQTAKVIAEHRDYTVRAASQETHEIGLLTSAFNHMLQQIQEQNQNLNYERDLLNTLMDNMPDSIYFKDRQSRYVRVSKSKLANARAFCQARHLAAHPGQEKEGLPEYMSSLERFAEYLEGKSDADFFVEEDARFIHAEEEEIARTGTPIIGKVERTRMLDGTIAWFMSTKMPWRDKEGKVIGTFGSSKNVTALKEIEHKLQTQLERLKLLDQITRSIGERQDLHSVFQAVIRRLEDHLPVDFACACVYDAVQQTLKVNAVGVRSETLAFSMAIPQNADIGIGQNGLARCLRGQLVHEPDVSLVPSPFAQRLAAGGLRAVVFAPLQVESQTFGILIAGRRQPRSFESADCEFLKQLSEHVALAAHQTQLHAALQKAFDDLRQSQQAVLQKERLSALGQMASGIAHDINNAIAPISLYTESLLESDLSLSPRARNYLQIIQRSMDDVAHTVSRMREFYRHGEPQLNSTAAQINVLVEQVLDLSRARWSDMPRQQGRAIQVATQLAPGLPDLSCVESEIREALINLVFNAADAMPNGGTLTLRTRLAPDQKGRQCIVVEVGDTGVGMNEETRRRCLEPFFTTKGDRGTGLGLAMVFGIVRRHAGELEIESEPGRGTTVRLLFPASPTTAEPSRPDAEIPLPPRQRILIVDDDPLLIQSLRDILERDGHIVVNAHGGKEGIAAFRAALDGRDGFDVVFTDLGMPSVDGRQVASSVKAASPSTPVILLTGWGERLLAEGEKPPHVDQVLSKPPKLRDLRLALNRCRTSNPGGGLL